MNHELRDKLEIEFIDKLGIAETLELISDICYLKNEHVRTNWHDSKWIADFWASVGSKVDTVRAKIQNDAKFFEGKV